jgi:hypothetical protein
MKKFALAVMLVYGVLAFGLQAHALSITPASTPQWSGNETSQNAINSIIEQYLGTAVLLYNADPQEADSGPLQNSYTTIFNGDLSGGTISYTGGSFIGDPQYMLVKDGNHTPAWYLFDLTSSWDGKEALVLSGFWPANGSISHISLYGSPETQVPEPTTILLLGLGLIGVAGFRRKFKK